MKKEQRRNLGEKIAQGMLKRFKEMHVLLIMQELLEGPHKEKLN